MEEKKLMDNVVTMGRNGQQQTRKITREVRQDAAFERRVEIRGTFIEGLAKMEVIEVEEG
jgi:hypothetical protein